MRLKQETDDTSIKHIRNIFRLKNENEANKDRIITDIRNLSEQGKEDYFKLVGVGNFGDNIYVI